MVTIEQARQQITQQRQQLDTSRQQIQQQERQVREAQLTRLTRTELQRRTQQDIVTRKQQEQQLSSQKQQALREFSPIKEDLARADTQLSNLETEVNRIETTNTARIKAASEFNRDLASAQKLVDKGLSFSGETARVQKFAQQIQQGREPEIMTIQEIPPTKLTGELLERLKRERITKTLQPKTIDVAPKGIERIRSQLQAFKLDTERKISGVIKTFLSKVDLSIPTSVVKETPVALIKLPPTIPGGTIQSRSVGFQDIDTGRLPPKQNLELATRKTILDFTEGNITEAKAVSKLELAQKAYILAEARRTAPARFVEGVALGATTIIAPPVGFTLIGLEGAKAVNQRKAILAFSKENPTAAATQFVSGVVGGFVGAGGASAIKIKSVILKDPKVTLVGSSRTKAMDILIENLSGEQRIKLSPQIKQTSTRVFEIDVPSPNNSVKLRIIEFGKGATRRFFGQEIVNNKVIGGVGGKTISKSGANSIGKLVTRSYRFHSKGGLTNVELAEFLERATSTSKKIKGRVFQLTKSEVRLSQKFRLGGLTPNQAREILRRPLFGIKEAQKRINKPFTKSEFDKAFKLSKSKVLIEKRLVKAKFTKINEQLEPLLAQKRFIDLKFIERGKGIVDIEVNIPKARVTGVEPKAIGLKGVIKIPIKGVTSKFKISKGKVVRTKPKTPLSRTFRQQTQEILATKLPPKQKLSLLKQLKEKGSPTGTFKAIAKTIQKEQVTSAIKQAEKKVPVTAVAIGLEKIPRLTRTQIRQRGQVLSNSFAFLDIPSSASKTFTTPQRLVKFGQLDFDKPQVAKNIDKLLRIERLSTTQLGKFRSLLKQGTKTLLKTQQENQQLIRTKIGLANKLALGGKITQAQASRLRQRLINRQLIRPKPITELPAIPITPPPIIKLPTGVTRTDLFKALTKIKKGTGINILVGQKPSKQKIIGRNLPPFKALKKGSRFVDKNIQASFKLVPTGKKAKTKDIKPFNVGIKFRPSKVNPLFVVEKRKFRLDSPFEVAQIKRAKASKPRRKRRKKK